MEYPSLLYRGEQCRKLDRIAIEQLGIPGIQLMKRAGSFACDQLMRAWPLAQSVLIYCGTGNNAGDGYIIATLLKSRGKQVRVKQIGDAKRLSGDALLAWQWMHEHEVKPDESPNTDADVVVDALLGTGAKGLIRPNFQAAIDEINNSTAAVLAVDVPSGIDANTGALLTSSPISADLTVTFVGNKLGLYTGQAVNHVGRVEFSDLGLPPRLYDSVEGIPVLPLTPNDSGLAKRAPGQYKNQAGHVLIVGGGRGMGGAAMLAAEAALRTGSGLVSLATHPDHVSAVLARRPEVMVRGVEENQSIEDLLARASVVAIGPGLGQDSWAESMLNQVIASAKPVVIDADALNLIASYNDTILPSDSIITPHPGEAGRLLRTRSATVEANRLDAVVELSKKYQTIAILKGAGTLIAALGQPHAVCPISVSTLATGGSGDVLCGMVAACRASGLPALTAASIAVWMHAQAGLKLQSDDRSKAVIASDIVDSIRIWD